MADAEYTRLHITPFSPALLNTFLPASILPNARNISYHNIQTFPEKGYGYVKLPTMDAEKIKKKLNGSILKGTKVKIEKARPEKEVVIEPQEPEPPKREKKKRKRDELPGVDIGERQVKRGWTTPAKEITKSKNKKPVNKSKYTTGPECLFKTNLPPNVASKTKIPEAKVDKKKKKVGKEIVVHEFAKTTKYATFLRDSSGANKTKHVAEFVQGNGWVDEEGNLVEEVVTKKRKHKAPTPEPPKEASASSDSKDSEDESASEQEADGLDAELTLLNTGANETSESSASEDSEDDSASDQGADHMNAEPTLLETNAKEASSSEDSSDESSSEAEIEDEKSNQPAEASSDSSDSSSSDSSSSDSSEDESEVEEPQSALSNRSPGRALSIKIPESNNPTPINTSVHPLEALYKRSKADASSSKEAAPSFSFFGADGDEEEIEEESNHRVPLTPFTQKDFEYRGLRSAAPTPDTAHPNKRFVWPTDDDDDEEPEVSSPIRRKESSEGTKEEKEGEAESEFQKWFWENRGNVDRSWKARRRAVAKENRQRENRKRQDRAL
jgi:hypothetical protein